MPAPEKRVQVKIEVGHQAICRASPTASGHTHDWSIFVRGAESADVSHFVEKVVFLLHESFPKPKRVCKEPPYKVSETGYGSFNLPVEVYFRNKEEPRKYRLEYDLTLQLVGMPPYNFTKVELLTFLNPSEDFEKKLIKGGAVILEKEKQGDDGQRVDPTSLPVSTSGGIPPRSWFGGKPMQFVDYLLEGNLRKLDNSMERRLTLTPDLLGSPLRPVAADVHSPIGQYPEVSVEGQLSTPEVNVVGPSHVSDNRKKVKRGGAATMTNCKVVLPPVGLNNVAVSSSRQKDSSEYKDSCKYTNYHRHGNGDGGSKKRLKSSYSYNANTDKAVGISLLNHRSTAQQPSTASEPNALNTLNNNTDVSRSPIIGNGHSNKGRSSNEYNISLDSSQATCVNSNNTSANNNNSNKNCNNSKSSSNSNNYYSDIENKSNSIYDTNNNNDINHNNSNCNSTNNNDSNSNISKNDKNENNNINSSEGRNEKSSGEKNEELGGGITETEVYSTASSSSYSSMELDLSGDDLFGQMVAKSIAKLPEGEIKEELKIEIQLEILAAKRKTSAI